MDDALRVLEGDCLFDGDTYPLAVRTAADIEIRDTLWYDLADDQWSAVRITPEEWELVSRPPNLFRRFALAMPQSMPIQGGSIERLGAFLNLRDNNAWVQLVAWLVAALIPDIAHPVLVVHGEQGSAKSTLMRLLSLLLDPSRTPLRTEPRELQEWVQMAHHSWLITLDNVSHLPNWLSDAICRAVTGEGFSKRQLYTDSDDIILNFRRVLALTGIEIVAQRADLLDRSILLALTPIPPDKRRLESEVLAEFENERPALFGALLTLLSNVLRVLPGVRLDSLPRMADFARIGVAVEQAMNWQPGTFMAAYEENIASQHEEALDASQVAISLRVFMQGRTHWTGTATALLAELPTDKIDVHSRDWPKSARSLSGHLKRLAPNLRAIGLHIEHSREGGSGQRLTTIEKKPVTQQSPQISSQPSRSSPQSHLDVTQTARTVTQNDLETRQPSRLSQSHGDDCDDSDDTFRDIPDPFNDDFDVPEPHSGRDDDFNLRAFRH
jgi:hypothetical protein